MSLPEGALYAQTDRYTLLNCHVLDGLRSLQSASVQCIVTSPPYLGLRAYGTRPQIWGGSAGCRHVWQRRRAYRDSPVRTGAEGPGFHDPAVTSRQRWTASESCNRCGAWRGELGAEDAHDCLRWARGEPPCSQCYVCHLRTILRELHRVLRSDGTLWLNLGDSYNGSGGAGGDYRPGGLKAGQPRSFGLNIPTLKPKDLIGIPWRVALAAQADGWFLRCDILWHKPNRLPESVKDRPSRVHEYLFLLTKSRKYFYDADAIREPHQAQSRERVQRGRRPGYNGEAPGQSITETLSQALHPAGRNRRSVWRIANRGFRGVILAADYVGGDDRPYKRSADCPVHSPPPDQQTSGIPEDGAQPEPPGPPHNRDTGSHPVRGCAGAQWASTAPGSPDYCRATAVQRISGSTAESRSAKLRSAPSVDDQTPCRTPRSGVARGTRPGSSDSPGHGSAGTASAHSRQTRRTGRAAATTASCMPGVQTAGGTLDTEAAPGYSRHGVRTPGSRKGTTDPGGDPLEHSSGGTTDSATSCNQSTPACTCQLAIGDHFATFPESLALPCILAGTSEKGACRVCGAPWRRLSEKGAPRKEQQKACGANAGGTYTGQATKDYQGARAQNPAAVKRRILESLTERRTTHLIPGCACGGEELVSCTVLDPFCGAGTTGLAALRQGRSFIGIEVKPEYCELTQNRLKALHEPAPSSARVASAAPPPARLRSRVWRLSRDGDPRALALFARHYSARRLPAGKTRRLFVGPGEKMVLLTARADALLVWRKFRSDNAQTGVNCAVFRNESRRQSSALLREGMRLAWQRWPDTRLYTYVNPKKIKSPNPGYCFKQAGWRTCGRTRAGLTILEALP